MKTLFEQRKEILAPLLVPEGVVFRPRKQDVEQLQQRDFLGKAKVDCFHYRYDPQVILCLKVQTYQIVCSEMNKQVFRWTKWG